MSRLTDILRQSWRKANNFFSIRGIVTFLLFLIFATILWYGHSMNAVRERTMRVPIEYVGIPDDIAFETVLPSEFQFTVRDQGKRLRAYSSDRLAAVQIDLTKQIKGEKGSIHISAEQVRPKITDQLQGTAKLQQVEPAEVNADYYRQHQKKVAVRLSVEVTPAAQYVFTQQPRLSAPTTLIYGSKEALDTIREVTTETMSISNVKDTLRRSVRLQAINGIRLQDEELELTAVAEQYTEKRFVIAITPQQVPAGQRLLLFPSSTEVTVQLLLSHFNDIKEKDIKVVCDYPATAQSTLPLKAKYNSPYILSTRLKEQEVEYIIEK